MERRLSEALRVRTRYPTRIPVICQRGVNATRLCPHIEKTKYLIPKNLTMGQFIWVVRNKLKLHASTALYMFINGTIPPIGHLLEEIYLYHKDLDGFLYIYYSTENTFG